MTEEERRIQACIDYINTSTDIVMWVKIMAMKALGRMKEHKNTFHVIDKTTGEEVSSDVLEELSDKCLFSHDIDGFAVMENGTILLVDSCGLTAYCDSDRFEVVWD